MNLLSKFLIILGLAVSLGYSSCCHRKKVGSLLYTFVDSRDTSSFGCLDSCVYEQANTPGSRYCFKRGHLSVECESSGTSGTPAPEGVIEREVVFKENGETLVQKDSHNHETGETILMVPAHGENIAITVIMHGDSRKMVVSSKDECKLQDIPNLINPDDIKQSNDNIDAKRKQEEEETHYRVHSERRLATEEEKQSLTASMKKECEGKDIMVSSVETIHQDDFKPTDDFSNTTSLKRIETSNRQGCGNVFVGCQIHTESNCYRWTYNGFGTTVNPRDATWFHFRDHHQRCVRCCSNENTILMPCKCIYENGEQAFSTAWAITNWQNGYGYECVPAKDGARSRFCNWDPNGKVPGCSYNNGACVNAGPDTCWPLNGGR